MTISNHKKKWPVMQDQLCDPNKRTCSGTCEAENRINGH